jgi:hypothetical protein
VQDIQSIRIQVKEGKQDVSICHQALHTSFTWTVGSPLFKIVGRVLHTHELSFLSNKASEAHVCDVCQQAKSRQLPFPCSDSVSKAPLELVFYMVGG